MICVSRSEIFRSPQGLLFVILVSGGKTNGKKVFLCVGIQDEDFV
jgi:hypothetical protein